MHTNMERIPANKDAISTVFLADDNLEDCKTFERALKEVGGDKKIHAMHNGKELLDIISHVIPDLLFIDLDMPGKSGVECIKEIRDDKRYSHLPIIVYSSTSRHNNIQVAYGMGADLFIVKPKEFNALVLTLEKILNMNWARPESIKEQYFKNNSYTPFEIEMSS